MMLRGGDSVGPGCIGLLVLVYLQGPGFTACLQISDSEAEQRTVGM